jgi:hypothetical protein
LDWIDRIDEVSIDIEGCGPIEQGSRIDSVSIDIEGCGPIESVSRIDSDIDRYRRLWLD